MRNTERTVSENNCAAPNEDECLTPNSHYAVSKAAASQYIGYVGRLRTLPIVVLRIYSAYGPYEDISRLIPNIVRHGLRGAFPTFVDPNTSRDFVYVDDLTEAFIIAAKELKPSLYGEVFNIGSGERTTICELALLAKELFGIKASPVFNTMPSRTWDLANWFANPAKARRLLGWSTRTPLSVGLRKAAEFFQSTPQHVLQRMSKHP